MCDFPNCKINSLPGKPFCIGHQKQFGLMPIKEDKPIAKKSDKRKQDDKEYKKMLKEMRAISNKCELKVQGVCTGTMEGLHHI